MSTSGTYNFGSIQNEQVITEAYERCGIPMALISQEKINTALRSINYILNSWLNKGLNLFTVKIGMMALTSGKTSYLLPNNGVDILEACLRTSSRNLGGAAESSPGGTADNAFDGNINTSCAQTGANGYISYDWGVGLYAITMVGVTSFVDRAYTLVFEYWNGSTWNIALSPVTQTYTAGENVWFDIPIPVPATKFRIRETGGQTLNIAELYFNTNVQDRILTRSSRSEYMSYPDKARQDTPTTFWVNRQVTPIVNLYPTPNSYYNNLFYSYIQTIEDTGTLIDTTAIPNRFIDALTSELAYRLGIKEEKLQILQILAKDASDSFQLAAAEDTERVPLRVFADYRSGWGSV